MDKTSVPTPAARGNAGRDDDPAAGLRTTQAARQARQEAEEMEAAQAREARKA
jgi:hypothetical protein